MSSGFRAGVTSDWLLVRREVLGEVAEHLLPRRTFLSGARTPSEFQLLRGPEMSRWWTRSGMPGPSAAPFSALPLSRRVLALALASGGALWAPARGAGAL